MTGNLWEENVIATEHFMTSFLLMKRKAIDPVRETSEVTSHSFDRQLDTAVTVPASGPQ